MLPLMLLVPVLMLTQEPHMLLLALLVVLLEPGLPVSPPNSLSTSLITTKLVCIPCARRSSSKGSDKYLSSWYVGRVFFAGGSDSLSDS
ncbi:hypothetical protein B9Z19DRAFT_1073390 [Tuber borchii]|uniref:Secreted protein n=1 Tax=Tuber borchii TaxID=42251 RepID=A0A2T7A5V9_TUBBO|nr:hypothetical protein B9Z19DRAFT_1073390 [Tuber borchii]